MKKPIMSKEPMEEDKNHPLNRKNYKCLLGYLKDRESCPISEIARNLELSKTTVAKLIARLQEKGVIESDGKGESGGGGGKRPQLYSIRRDFKYGLTFVLPTENRMECKVWDMGASIIYESAYNFEKRIEYEEVLEGMEALYKEVKKRCSIDSERIYGIVISSDGIVLHKEGIIYSSVTFRHWGYNKPIKQDFLSLIGEDIPLYLDNCCRFSGYAEMVQEANQNYDSIVVLYNSTVSVGVGGCIIQHHRMQYGMQGMVGELGHMIVEPDLKEACRCGNRGCFEQVASCKALVEKAKQYYLEEPDSALYYKAKKGILNADDVLRLSNQKEQIACRVLSEIAELYAMLIYNLIVIVNPDAVILQGLFTEKGEYFISQLREKIRMMPFFHNGNQTVIKFSECGLIDNDIFHMGAARFARDRFLEQINI